MRRKLNWKFLAGLLGVVAVACGVIVVTHRFQVNRSASGLLYQANKAEVEGRLAKSQEYLSRYIAYRPDDTTSLARFGLVLDKAARSRPERESARAVLEKVLVSDPSRRDVRLRAAQLAIELAAYPDARQHLAILSEGDSASDDKTIAGEPAHLLGKCDEAEGNFNDASANYVEAIKASPDLIECYVRLAGLLRDQLKRPDEADAVMDAGKADKAQVEKAKGKTEPGVIKLKEGLITANPQSFRAYLERAIYSKRFDLPGAAETAAADVKRAMELAPEEADVLVAAADVAFGARDAETARKHLARGAELHPQDVRMYQALAALEQNEKRSDEAVAALEKGVAALPNEGDLKWYLAELLAETGKLDEANARVAELRDVRFPDEPLEYLRGLIGMRLKKWDVAAETLERTQALLATRPEWTRLAKRALVMLAQCYEQLGDRARQKSALVRAVAIDLPEDSTLWATARLRLAALLEAEGKLDESMEEYRRILVREPEYRDRVPDLKATASYALARLAVRRNAELPLEERNWSKVEADLRTLAGSSESAATAALLARVLAVQGKFDEARAVLVKARDREPDEAALWLGLIELAVQQGKADDAGALIDAAEKQLGDRVAIRLARASSLAERGGEAALQGLAALERDVDKFPEAERRQLARGLALAYDRAGSPKDAARAVDGLIDAYPGDTEALLLAFDFAMRDGDEARMSGLVGQIEKAETAGGRGGVMGPYSRVRLLVHKATKGGPDQATLLGEARKLMNAIVAGEPKWARGALTVAEIEDLAKSPDAALTEYLRAIELGERSPTAFRRAVYLLTERGRNVDADRLMRKLLQWGQSADDLKLASDASYRAQDYERAEDLAARAVKAAPDDYRNHVWLGRVMAASASRAAAMNQQAESAARRSDAEKAFRRAVDLKADAPDAWLVLVQYLVSVGNRDAASAAIQDAQRRIPAGKVDLALAPCFEALGDEAKASERYAAALKASPDDLATLRAAAEYDLRSRRLGDAEPHLRKLIGAEAKEPETAAWARRTLAIVKAAGQDPQRAEKALEVLGLSDGKGAPRGADDASVDDLRTQAQVLAMQPGREPRRKAIAILERVIERESIKNPDLFLVAQLYEADGDGSNARDRLNALVTADPMNPNYLAYLARFLIRRGEVREAQVCLTRLGQVEPNSAQTVEVKARLLKAEGKGGEAAALLTAFIQDDPTRLEPVARLLEQLGLDDAAEQTYSRLAAQSKQPEATLAHAGFVGRRGRTREAIDLCERSRKTLPAVTVINAGVSVIMAAKGREDVAPQVERVDAWLNEALLKSPDEPNLLVPQALLRACVGRYDEAQAIYRRILSRDEANVAALNNLAWLLALKYGKGPESEAMIEKAIGVVGPLPALRDTRAVVRLSMGRGDLAVEDLLEATTLEPSAAGFFHLAQAYEMSKDRTAAAKALDHANKELGLKANDLDPLERDHYQRLVGELARK